MMLAWFLIAFGVVALIWIIVYFIRKEGKKIE